jgi:3-methylfumaryl-CoA hydratase
MTPTDWIGRTETVAETLSPGPLQRWCVSLGIGPERIGDGTPLPPAAHWAYFRQALREDEVLSDGHSEIDGLLPSDPDHPRRMWAGGDLTFHDAPTVGAAARRVSVVEDVTRKDGRSGSLLFIAVRHRIETADGRLLIDERQDMVRRAAPKAGGTAPPTKPAPETAVWSEPYAAGSLRLFRYSAVTFNGHKIHYDRDYAEAVEMYPALVVHGPMLATLLMDLAQRRSGRSLATFAYRATAPVFEDEPFTLNGSPNGNGAHLFVAGADGRLAMTADATFKPASPDS